MSFSMPDMSSLVGAAVNGVGLAAVSVVNIKGTVSTKERHLSADRPASWRNHHLYVPCNDIMSDGVDQRGVP